jgi:nucleotide-binding universal stress UspA family protein
MEIAHVNPDNQRSVKYLVCVDHREESRVALRLACMKAKARNYRIDLLHVITPTDFQTLGGVADRMREEQMGEAQELLNALSDDVRQTFGITPGIILREGSTGDEIVSVALQDPDTIIIYLGIAQQSSSRGKLASWLAGQLGSKLFVPLLMVPGNLTEQQLQTLV